MRRIAISIMGCGLLACTFTTPQATPTLPPSAQPTAETPLSTVAVTATLRPTPTNMPTFTPVNSGIATPIPIQATANNGGGESASIRSGGNSDDSSTIDGVAPVGVRDAAPSTPVQSSSGSFSAESEQGNSGSFSIQVAPVTATVGAGTPTVPPRAYETYTYPVAEGRSLVVFYEIEVLRGTVILWAVSPSGEVVWQQGFTETINDETEINVPEAGDYTIFTFAERFSGSYQVSYGTR